MAQNISWLGNDYTDVPFIELPKTAGGQARFDDTTVTTAEASDVAEGKIFVSQNGTITIGTGSGGGELTFKNKSLKPTSKTEFIVTGIEAEPKLFFLYLSQDQTTAASMPNYLLAVDSIGKNCLYIKQNGTQYSVQSTPITFFGTKRLEYSYENGQFTITVLNTTSVGQLLTQKNYIFAYAY